MGCGGEARRSQKTEDPIYERNEQKFQDDGKRRCQDLENKETGESEIRAPGGMGTSSIPASPEA